MCICIFICKKNNIHIRCQQSDYLFAVAWRSLEERRQLRTTTCLVPNTPFNGTGVTAVVPGSRGLALREPTALGGVRARPVSPVKTTRPRHEGSEGWEAVRGEAVQVISGDCLAFQRVSLLVSLQRNCWKFVRSFSPTSRWPRVLVASF